LSFAVAALVACILTVAGPALAGNGASVNLGIKADRSSYASGEALRFTLTVENRGSQPVTLTFRTAQRFDVRIHDAAGREVWRWSADRMFGQAIGEERLEPGARRSWDVIVRDALPGGSYKVVASLEAVNLKVSSSVRVTVR
jgi:hypothetical protein